MDITSAGSGVSVGIPEVSANMANMVNIDGTWRYVYTFDSETQLTLTESIGTAGPVAMYGGWRSNPTFGWTGCKPGININPIFRNNIIRNVSRGIKLTGGVNGSHLRAYGYTVHNNLVYNSIAATWDNQTGTIGSATSLFSINRPTKSMRITNNTFLGATSLTAVDGEAGTPNPNPGDTVFLNNIFQTGWAHTTTFRVTNFATGHTSMAAALSRGVSPVPISQWNKNMFPGGTVSTFSTSPGQTLNLCAGAASSCPTMAFSDYLKRNYRASHADLMAKGTDGRDIGANVRELPQILNHQVKITDRMVLFDWQVTAPIRHIPCVVEVATTPDFEDAVQGAQSGRGNTYAGELATVGLNPRVDADDHDRYPRPANTGQRFTYITGLAASTTYYYRHHCGGDSRTGGDTPTTAYLTFTTVPTLSGTTTFSRPGSSMTVGYGYSRTTDTISSTVSVSCASGTCSAAVNRGVPIYFSVDGKPVRVTTP